MGRFFRIIGLISLCLILTVLTQLGGVLLIICLPLFQILNRKFTQKKKRIFAKCAGFVVIYLFVSIVVIPPLAKLGGRVPLPLFSWENVRPLNIGTCLLNRHYVRPELKTLLFDSAKQIEKDFPGSVVAYMDANHPFWDGYPLIPHLSHKDGKKVDIAFFYTHSSTRQAVHRSAPTWIGYGSCERPGTTEVDQARICSERGYWQYSLLDHLTLGWWGRNLRFDQQRTKRYLQILAADPQTGKIFLEPHLTTRLGLSAYSKIRFHGCHAVRHDDHIHLQL